MKTKIINIQHPPIELERVKDKIMVSLNDAIAILELQNAKNIRITNNGKKFFVSGDIDNKTTSTITIN